MIRVLETILRLSHPLMPFITEEIWQKIKPLAGATGDTIMLGRYPQADESRIDAEASYEVDAIQRLILLVRNIRGQYNVSPGQDLPIYIKGASHGYKEVLDRNRPLLKKMASIENISWLEQTEEGPFSASGVIGSMTILVPMADLIDKDAEITRLKKEQGKLQQEIDKITSKLSNPAFLEKAPAEIVTNERKRVIEYQNSLEKLNEEIAKINSL